MSWPTRAEPIGKRTHDAGRQLPDLQRLGLAGGRAGGRAGLHFFGLLRLKRREPLGPYDLFAALALDALALTVQLYFSGGATNPFTTLYLLHVILGAVLLEAWATRAIVALISFCFVGLIAFNRPIIASGLSDQAFFELFVMGMLIGVVLDALLLVTFVGRINTNLRQHDARLAELR